MNLRILLASLLVLGAVAAFTAPAFTEDEEPEAPGMPSEEDMADAWQALATPGPEHQWMAFLVGSWDGEAKFWMNPGEPPQTSTGRLESRWILGRRFIRSDYTGDWEGKTFHGEATMGFSNATKEYETAWIDDMSTAIARSSGTRKGDVVTLTGKAHIPMMGEVSFVQTWTKESADAYVMSETWDMGPMGTHKVMEIRYTRAK